MKTSLTKTLSDDFLNRHFIGYGSILNDFISFSPTTTSFPPYNIIEIDNDTVEIELAVAGFEPNEISVTVEKGILTIEGKQIAKDAQEKTYRYRGISTRSFLRSFRLAEYWEVRDATFDNGILKVVLKQEIPEEQRPKKIDIKTK